MKKPLLKVFNVKCIDLYNNLLKKISTEPMVLQIKHNTSEDIFQQLSLDILNSYMHQPTLTLNEGPYKADHKQLELNNSVAGELIGNGFSFSPSRNSIINHITYEIPFTGDKNAIQYTVNLYERFLPIEFQNNKIILNFYVQKTIEEAANQLKADRDAIIDMINNNQKEVNMFWKSKKDSLLSQIRNEINKKYEAEKKKNELNNLLS